MSALGPTWFSAVLELVRLFKTGKRDERIGTQEGRYFITVLQTRVKEFWRPGPCFLKVTSFFSIIK